MSDPFEHAKTCAEEREIALTLPRDQLVSAVKSHSWDGCVVSTMSAIADRPDCPLIAVLYIFDYAAEYEYSEAGRDNDGGGYDLLKRIEARINSGGYTHFPEDHVPGDAPLIDPFLAGISNGPWSLDPKSVEPARRSRTGAPDPEAAERKARELFAEMNAARKEGHNSPEMVQMYALRTAQAGKEVEDGVVKLARASVLRRRVLTYLVHLLIWGGALWLMWPSLSRMFFGGE